GLSIPTRQRNAVQTRVSERSTRSWGTILIASVLQFGRETRLRGATVSVQIAPGASFENIGFRIPTRQRNMAQNHASERSNRSGSIHVCGGGETGQTHQA